jgi:hypothetical protein
MMSFDNRIDATTASAKCWRCGPRRRRLRWPAMALWGGRKKLIDTHSWSVCQ